MTVGIAIDKRRNFTNVKFLFSTLLHEQTLFGIPFLPCSASYAATKSGWSFSLCLRQLPESAKHRPQNKQRYFLTPVWVAEHQRRNINCISCNDKLCYLTHMTLETGTSLVGFIADSTTKLGCDMNQHVISQLLLALALFGTSVARKGIHRFEVG